MVFWYFISFCQNLREITFWLTIAICYTLLTFTWASRKVQFNSIGSSLENSEHNTTKVYKIRFGLCPFDLESSVRMKTPKDLLTWFECVNDNGSEEKRIKHVLWHKLKCGRNLLFKKKFSFFKSSEKVTLCLHSRAERMWWRGINSNNIRRN